MKKQNSWTALLCIGLSLGQAVAPLAARADGAGSADNPFSHVPAPVVPVKPQAPYNVPVRPTPLAPPVTDEPLVCLNPNADDSNLTPFEKLVGTYIAAYYADDPVRTHYLSQIAQKVFANPGSQEYIDDLKYLDAQGDRAPEAMYDAGRTLQNRWEAAYGAEINQRLALGVDASAAGNLTLGERRNERIHIGESGGALVGATIALAALGVIAIRNPSAVPRYMAVFRAILPAVGFVGGFGIGHGLAEGVNALGLFERNIPLAPAHVMRLGVEKDDFTQNDETLVRTLVPLVLSIGAGEAAYAALEGETIVTTLLTAVRAFRAAGMAASAAEIEFPPGLIATVIVTMLVDRLATYTIDQVHYDSLKSDVESARKIVDYGVSSNDNLTLYRGADTLVAKTLGMAAYINRPILEANTDFIAGMEKAKNEHPPESPEFKAAMTDLTRKLSTKVRDAQADQDQAGDADYEAYMALGALEHANPELIEKLPDLAKNRAASYIKAFQTYSQGFESYLPQLEQSQGSSLGIAARTEAYNGYFRKYISGMRTAKDKQLTAAFRAGAIPRHAGHVLLQASAMLRTTGREYVKSQADTLMAEVTRQEVLIRAATAPAASGIDPVPYQGSPGW